MIKNPLKANKNKNLKKQSCIYTTMYTLHKQYHFNNKNTGEVTLQIHKLDFKNPQT